MAKKLFITLGLVLLYTLAAQVGFLSALLPDWSVTLIWPASGIAVAALLLFGAQARWGIFLGAVATNLIPFWATLTPAMIGISLTIASGSTLAAIAASQALLLIAPNAPKSVSANQLLKGSSAIFFACGIAAIVGVSCLYISSLVPRNMVWVNLAMWWLGDFCGVMIFGPMAWLIARAVIAPGKKLKLVPVITALSVNSAFVAVSLLLFMLLWNSETSAISRLLWQEAERAAHDMTEELQEAGHSMVAIRALFYASDHVTAENFHRYVTTELEDQQLSGIQGIGWAPHVTNPKTWEKNIQHDAQLPSTQVQLYERDSSGQRSPVAQRDEYFPVQYIEPLAGNQAAIGFDLGSEKSRRAALERARDSGEVSMVAPINLVQAEETTPAILICAPIYRPDTMLETVAARRANLTGFASAVYYIRPLFSDALTNSDSNIDLHLFDRSQPGDARWYHTNASPYRASDWKPNPDVTPASLMEQENGVAQISFANHDWLVVATPGPGFLRAQRTWTPWGALVLTLALGLVISSILLERIAALIIVNRERKKTELAVLEAMAANESKAYFMAAASHDIKQPLYALSILTDTLLMSDPRASSMPTLERLKKSIVQMTDHFDALIDAGKFQEGSFEFSPGRVLLGDIAERIDSEIAPSCARKGLAWNLDMDNVLAFTDPELLMRLLRNLLSNALRNTDQGAITCTAKTQGDVVEFHIIDTGCGIAPEHQQSIFEEYVRVDNGRARSTGTGIGLSIVAKIAQTLDMDLKISSTPGLGTQFSFQIPMVSGV